MHRTEDTWTSQLAAGKRAVARLPGVVADVLSRSPFRSRRLRSGAPTQPLRVMNQRQLHQVR